MTLKEVFTRIGGDYEGVVSRLCNEKLVERFVLKFSKDESYAQLCDFLRQENYNEAFRMAHTLKGVSQNLGFTRLYEASHELTEALRDGKRLEKPELLDRVGELYKATMETIEEYKSSNAL